MKTIRTLLLSAVCLIPALMPPAARADLQLQFNTTFSNSVVPAPAAPWLTAVLKTFDSEHVELTLTAALHGGEYISEAFFNVTGNPLTVSALLPATGSGATALTKVEFNNDANKEPADGGGYYDIRLSFNTANSGNRFDGTDSLSFLFERSGLTEDDFNELADAHGSNGPYVAAAHVQGITSTAGNSTWIAGDPISSVPEPATIIFSGMVLVFLSSRFRSRRRA